MHLYHIYLLQIFPPRSQKALQGTSLTIPWTRGTALDLRAAQLRAAPLRALRRRCELLDTLGPMVEGGGTVERQGKKRKNIWKVSQWTWGKMDLAWLHQTKEGQQCGFDQLLEAWTGGIQERQSGISTIRKVDLGRKKCDWTTKDGKITRTDNIYIYYKYISYIYIYIYTCIDEVM